MSSFYLENNRLEWTKKKRRKKKEEEKGGRGRRIGSPGQPGLNSKILSHEEEGEAGEEGEGKAGHRLDSSVQVNGSGDASTSRHLLYLLPLAR